jgi:hypothetical protein
MDDDRVHCAQCLTKCARRTDAAKRCYDYKSADGVLGSNLWPNMGAQSEAVRIVPKRGKQ